MNEQLELIRVCKSCGEMFPATTEFFPVTKNSGKTYLQRTCRTCHYAKAKERNRAITARCEYEGCERTQHSRGYCSTHHKHLRTTGVLEKTKNYPYKDVPTYNGMHQRVRLAKGYATLHKCGRCEKQAEDWALDHDHASTIITGYDYSGRLTKYSTNVDDYIPLCSSCHLKWDFGLKKVSA